MSQEFQDEEKPKKGQMDKGVPKGSWKGNDSGEQAHIGSEGSEGANFFALMNFRTRHSNSKRGEMCQSDIIESSLLKR